MCGIYGIYSGDGPRLDAAILKPMDTSMVHRGPDDTGHYIGDGIAMGMRRLSIIDLEGGHQPIANEDRSVFVVCNGEIYNYRELREELKRNGHTFSTGSDTEVLVHLYEQFGDDFVEHLSGMFGFALWDSKHRRLLIARDRLGIKPLYVLRQAGRVVFASEAKTILKAPGVSARLDPVALGEYLSLGYVPAPFSMLEGIEKLPAGSMMVCDAEGVRIRKYWQLPNKVDDSLTPDDCANAILETMERAVVSQMVSDVPLGAFLSGGIDSSAVVALMSRNSDQPVKTFSIGFGGSSGGAFYNELPYAKQVAELFETEHQEILVEPNVVRLLPKLLWHLDEPIADAAFITTYLVSEFAQKSVSVILSGVGGDELFGGYRRYLGEYYGQQYQRVPAWIRRNLLMPVAKRLPSDRHSPLLNLSRYAKSFILASELPFEDRYMSYVGVFDDAERDAILRSPLLEPANQLAKAFGQTHGDRLQRLFAVDMATQLPDDLLMLTDKMSMATSLECRVPLLDDALIELAARIPSAQKIHGRELKHSMKRAVKTLLPDSIIHRKKRGFGAPFGAWLKNEISPVLRSVLSKESVDTRGLFDWSSVQRTIAMHESSEADHTDHLMCLMNLELWCRLYLDGESADDLADQLEAETAG